MTRTTLRAPSRDITGLTRQSAIAFALVAALAATACGPKDADVKTAAQAALTPTPGVSVDVADGVATITGQFADSAAMMSGAAAVKSVKGVKSVVDNATVAPPPPPAVVMSPDDSLRTNVQTALKDHPTLSADVKGGVVTLTGTVAKAELTQVMQALNALHPRKVQNQAKVTK